MTPLHSELHVGIQSIGRNEAADMLLNFDFDPEHNEDRMLRDAGLRHNQILSQQFPVLVDSMPLAVLSHARHAFHYEDQAKQAHKGALRTSLAIGHIAYELARGQSTPFDAVGQLARGLKTLNEDETREYLLAPSDMDSAETGISYKPNRHNSHAMDAIVERVIKSLYRSDRSNEHIRLQTLGAEQIINAVHYFAERNHFQDSNIY